MLRGISNPMQFAPSKKFLVLLAIHAFPIAVFAEIKRLPIKVGMAKHEVILNWGEPIDKVEEEVKRIEYWNYPGPSTITFKESKVISWTGHSSEQEKAHKEISSTKTSGKNITVPFSEETRDLVREIAREVPSAPDNAGGAPGLPVNDGTVQDEVTAVSPLVQPQFNAQGNPVPAFGHVPNPIEEQD